MFNWRVLGLSVFLILALGQWNIEQAKACSLNHVATIQEFLVDHEYAIRAEVIEVDDAHMNAILQVKSYLSGNIGPEYIVFSQFSPSETHAKYEGFQQSSCDSTPIYMSSGDQIITFVNRSLDGTYRPLSTGSQGYEPIYVFPPNMAVEYRNNWDFSDSEPFPAITVEELTESVLAHSKAEPLLPILNKTYPLAAPLLIRTSTHRAYMMPIDNLSPVWIANNVQFVSAGSERIAIINDNTFSILERSVPHLGMQFALSGNVSCQRIRCAGFSPSGLRMALANERDQDKLQLIDSFAYIPNYHYDDVSDNDPIRQDYRSFEFSSDDRAIAIWYPDEIIVYTCYTTESIHCQEHRFSTLLDFDNHPEWQGSSSSKGAWSPDSRLLAFTDENGLWLWDVYTSNSTPRLLKASVEQSGLPYAVHFSPLGRYIAYEQDSKMAYLDTVSGQELPYGYFSPDESTLIVTELTQEERHFHSLDEHDSLLCYMKPFNCYSTAPTKEVVWLSNTSHIGIRCYPADEICRFVIDENIYVIGEEYRYIDPSTYYETSWLNAITFDYEPHSNYAVIQNDTQTITLLNISNPGEHTTLNLDPYLDGDIVSVEWLPSVFYYE